MDQEDFIEMNKNELSSGLWILKFIVWAADDSIAQ